MKPGRALRARHRRPGAGRRPGTRRSPTPSAPRPTAPRRGCSAPRRSTPTRTAASTACASASPRRGARARRGRLLGAGPHGARAGCRPTGAPSTWTWSRRRAANTGLHAARVVRADRARRRDRRGGQRSRPAGSVVAADGAGPVVVDGDDRRRRLRQRIDSVSVTMSEPVTYAGDGAAPFALGAAGYTVAERERRDAAARSRSTWSSPRSPTRAGRPAISYAGGGSLRDLAGVEAVVAHLPRPDPRHPGAGVRRAPRPPTWTATAGSTASTCATARTSRAAQHLAVLGERAHRDRHRVLRAAGPDRDRRGRRARHRRTGRRRATRRPAHAVRARQGRRPRGRATRPRRRPAQSLVQADDKARPGDRRRP